MGPINASLVSIIVPIYNAQEYIDRCLGSIVKQTYSDIEILCVVNGSTDRSEELVEKWRNQDGRIKLFVSSIADLGTAVNRGLDEAQGDYVAFVDVDDWVEENYISSLLVGIEKGYRLCKANHVIYDGKQNQKAYARDGDKFVSIRGSSWMTPFRQTAIYEKSLFEGLRYIESCYYEDLSLWPILVARAGGFYYVDEATYYYNKLNDDSIMSVRDSRHLVLDRVFEFIFSNLTPDLDREVNLLVTALFIQAFWTSNVHVIGCEVESRKYISRVKKVVGGRLPGYHYMVDLLSVPQVAKEAMISFYKDAL